MGVPLVFVVLGAMGVCVAMVGVSKAAAVVWGGRLGSVGNPLVGALLALGPALVAGAWIVYRPAIKKLEVGERAVLVRAAVGAGGLMLVVGSLLVR